MVRNKLVDFYSGNKGKSNFPIHFRPKLEVKNDFDVYVKKGCIVMLALLVCPTNCVTMEPDCVTMKLHCVTMERDYTKKYSVMPSTAIVLHDTDHV
jgi:hypothetical protein